MEKKKTLKRLQTSLPLDKTTNSDENHHRLCKSDSSLLSTTNSVSPPLDSTIPTYRNHNIPYHDTTFFNFHPSYDSFYNPTYGYYQTNNYNPTFF